MTWEVPRSRTLVAASLPAGGKGPEPPSVSDSRNRLASAIVAPGDVAHTVRLAAASSPIPALLEEAVVEVAADAPVWLGGSREMAPHRTGLP
jgi:hypothetical protein